MGTPYSFLFQGNERTIKKWGNGDMWGPPDTMLLDDNGDDDDDGILLACNTFNQLPAHAL